MPKKQRRTSTRACRQSSGKTTRKRQKSLQRLSSASQAMSMMTTLSSGPSPAQPLLIRPGIIPAFHQLYRPRRFKVFKGGRGSAKSWEAAKKLVLDAYQAEHRILCVREFQNSINDSVHRLLADTIQREGLGLWFDITNNSIKATETESEFLFKGMRQNFLEVKSTEGVTRCWYEEAQKASKNSLEILSPTIRTEGSELIFTYNPVGEDDPIDDMFIKKGMPDSIVRHVNYDENPFFPDVLRMEAEHMLAADPAAYEHVWRGGYLKISDAIIFSKKVEIGVPVAPPNARFHFGMDFGFANDPSAVIRFWIDKDILYVDYEAFGYGVELDDLPQLMNSVPSIQNWPIKADSARPETISYLRRKGYQIAAAEKWNGCVEDGIAHVKGFKKIVVHERCKHLLQESRLYSYKVDKITGDVLPIIVDKHNNGWDAIRYGLDGDIQKRGALGVWERIGRREMGLE